MKLEVGYGEADIEPGVQGRSGSVGWGTRGERRSGGSGSRHRREHVAPLGEGTDRRPGAGVSRSWAVEARTARDRAVAAGGGQAAGGARHPKKGRSLLREGSEMRFAFIAKQRSVWPVSWLCEALDVSRSGFHAWLHRGPSARAQFDEQLTAKVRTSFVGSARTYGARRVWRDVLAEGAGCGLHKIERLMRANAFRARPRRRG